MNTVTNKRQIENRSSNVQKKKRVTLTNSQRYELCLQKKKERGIRNRDLAAKFGISESSCSEILAKSDHWLSINLNSKDANNKRTKKPVYIDIESAVALWAEHVIGNKQTLTGYLIQDKAKEFAQLLNEDKFNASNGWLHNFKKRYNIREYKRQGEADSAPLDKLPEFRCNLQSIIQPYQLDDVFNCDETSLYYRMEPSRTLAMGPVSGTKKAKDRVTVLLTANATGSEKLKPLLIHKYKNPHSIRNIEKKKMPVNYFWNKSAWMQKSIWKHYIEDLNSEMQRQKRHILLLIDGAPTHVLDEDVVLTNIKIETLPPYTTAHIQPMDAGIINSFKASIQYYSNMNKRMKLLYALILVFIFYFYLFIIHYFFIRPNIDVFLFKTGWMHMNLHK
jgi:hypothetical protein